MQARYFADLTVAIHFAYVAFVVFALPVTLIGGAAGWRWVRNRWFRGLHLAMIGIVVVEAWAGVTCPLTLLENYLRAQSGNATYRGDFIATWLHEAMFFDPEPWVFTVLYTTFGLAVLASFFVVRPNWAVASDAEPYGKAT
ncbi:DUF2784 domain-containing protein [Rhodopirellula sp. MGV]|uniref:DUF2784 domain-containing protein n=1 Tax=Rhodopirellula sp. MGV TaxID=2023130 RepID=UPI000B9681DC|nr:DUF2784 domain-containing protein [Rhodopirellula sp. MGV]OYP38359.1 hypothetical protein CGZ80_02080 [Rhodopirellula sp. MGV]PNY34218.1 DUF2784 domain-containing protein [Rhodopirellula baltica]